MPYQFCPTLEVPPPVSIQAESKVQIMHLPFFTVQCFFVRDLHFSPVLSPGLTELNFYCLLQHKCQVEEVRKEIINRWILQYISWHLCISTITVLLLLNFEVAMKLVDLILISIYRKTFKRILFEYVVEWMTSSHCNGFLHGLDWFSTA